MRTSCALVSVVLCLLPMVLPKPTLAQRPGGPAEMVHLNGDGIVKAVRPRVLLVTVGTEDWLIAVPENYQQLLYEAPVTARWLQRTMPVQMTATLIADRRKREYAATQPVAELTVAPLPANSQPGIFPEQGMEQGASLFSRDKKSAQPRSRDPDPTERKCLVIGQLAEYKDGQLRINAGGYAVRCELAPQAEITLRWHDVRFVQVGDKVQFTAHHPAGRKGQAQAETMNISPAAPLDRAEPPVRGGKKAEPKEESGVAEQKKDA